MGNSPGVCAEERDFRVNVLRMKKQYVGLEIEQEQRTLDQLRTQTSGEWLHEAGDGGRQVVPGCRSAGGCGNRIQLGWYQL